MTGDVVGHTGSVTDIQFVAVAMAVAACGMTLKIKVNALYNINSVFFLKKEKLPEKHIEPQDNKPNVLFRTFVHSLMYVTLSLNEIGPTAVNRTATIQLQ